MTRSEQLNHNQQIIEAVKALINQYAWLPAYKDVVVHLNDQGLLTSRGNSWTRKSLFRMLQRTGYSGLHGLRQSSSRLSKCQV